MRAHGKVRLISAYLQPYTTAYIGNISPKSPECYEYLPFKRSVTDLEKYIPYIKNLLKHAWFSFV